MAKNKRYTFECKGCGILFEAIGFDKPLCRWCVQRGKKQEDYGKPNPTGSTTAKWEAAKRAKAELGL